MAFCDSTTVNVDQDLVSVRRVSKDRIGEIQMAYYNANHRWYFFPRMKNFQEVLIFKTYDSLKDDNDGNVESAKTGTESQTAGRMKEIDA